MGRWKRYVYVDAYGAGVSFYPVTFGGVKKYAKYIPSIDMYEISGVYENDDLSSFEGAETASGYIRKINYNQRTNTLSF